MSMASPTGSGEWEFENQQQWKYDEDSVGITGWEARIVMMMDENGVSELLRIVLYDNDNRPMQPMFWFPESMRIFATSMLEGLDNPPPQPEDAPNETG